MRSLYGVGLLMMLMLPVAAPAASGTLSIPASVSYDRDLNVPNAVRVECEVERKLAKYLAKESKGRYKKVVMEPNISAATAGHALEIRVTGLLAPGGGKWSGPKSLTTQGTLYDNGQVIGSFTARRHTRRGKHTCGMLHRNAEEIAEDIGEWLRKPTMDARLGDAD